MYIRRISILFVILALSLFGAALLPRPVMAGGGWHAEFFNNQTLSGSPVYSWDEPWIGHEWGTDAPSPGLIYEHFSIRWTRSFQTDKKRTYQFCAMADDGVRIKVNNVWVLDEWHANNGIAYCGSQYTLPKGEYDVQVEYYENGGESLIYVWWEDVDPFSPFTPVISPDSVPEPPPVSVPSVSSAGPAPFDAWYGEYFGNRSLSGQPDRIRLDPWIGFDWNVGAPFAGMTDESFSIRWRRSAMFEAGYYKFCATADDGVRMWVDDVLALDKWYDNGSAIHCHTLNMAKGVHQVHVEYYEDRGSSFIYAWWKEEKPHRWY